MSETPEIDYPQLLDEALLGVVQRVLRRAAEEGLPGEHHFFLSFRTQAPGVSVPKHLATLHPDQMTIVLQHQFWDLRVEDDAVSVLLRFGGAPERVTIPFAALTGFSDPSVQFALPLNSAAASRSPQPPAAPEPTAALATEPAPAAEPRAPGRIVEFRRPARPAE